ncbi:MAG: DUF1934 domain-containing protein [Lachnospiraceae bacterium]|nr:DUF1934 domain-containing protein [Lachnospiraceae bacterium]
MTKEVLVSISGLQFELDEKETEAIEVICPGEYYFRNGKHYIIYEELIEEEGIHAVTKCTLKITDKQVDLVKKGTSNVHMVFELGKNHMTYYNTPFGDLMMGITTTDISLTKEGEDFTTLLADLSYALDINYEFAANCTLKIKVQSK